MNPLQHPSESDIDQLGNQLGELRSASEIVQAGIILGGIATFALLVCITPIPVGVAILGCPITVGVAYWLAMRSPYLGSSLNVFEHGIRIVTGGNRHEFLYESITIMSTRTQDHHHKGVYLATKIEMEFQTEKPIRMLKFQCDFRKGGRRETLITQLLANCSEGVQQSLCEKLDAEGQLRWTPTVCLDMDGISRFDSDGNAQAILFENIEDWKLEDNQLKIWKTEDVLPSIVIPNSSPNFMPHFALFCRMKNYFHETDQKAGAEIVEASATEHATLTH